MVGWECEEGSGRVRGQWKWEDKEGSGRVIKGVRE